MSRKPRKCPKTCFSARIKLYAFECISRRQEAVKSYCDGSLSHIGTTTFLLLFSEFVCSGISSARLVKPSLPHFISQNDSQQQRTMTPMTQPLQYTYHFFSCRTRCILHVKISERTTQLPKGTAGSCVVLCAGEGRAVQRSGGLLQSKPVRLHSAMLCRQAHLNSTSQKLENFAQGGAYQHRDSTCKQGSCCFGPSAVFH